MDKKQERIRGQYGTKKKSLIQVVGFIKRVGILVSQRSKRKKGMRPRMVQKIGALSRLWTLM